ncbi:hypothetical protein [Clavibacter zhangzhiyongii]|uniref:hypothetical protein n=1 Tax=Clavibacter zhangzhiyongii TaxID=2768071 RepID=UPI0039DF508A
MGEAVRDAAHEGAEQVRHGVEDVVGDTLGTVQVSNDGHLPDSFPADAVPFAEGQLLGGEPRPRAPAGSRRSGCRTSRAGSPTRGRGSRPRATRPSEVASDAASGYGRFTTDALHRHRHGVRGPRIAGRDVRGTAGALSRRRALPAQPSRSVSPT